MKAAYVDTSCLVAIAFDERAGEAIQKRLTSFDRLFSSNLLEAELRAACAREDVTVDDSIVDGIDWILPDRPLGPEIKKVLDAGYVRGADCWHLATALFLAKRPEELAFVTLDEPQRKLARKLGFSI